MNKQNKQTVAASLLLVAAVMVGSAEAGLIENLTQWWWNYINYAHFLAGTVGCWVLGGWGIFLNDDSGLMIQRCMDLYGVSGGKTFPFEYSLN